MPKAALCFYYKGQLLVITSTANKTILLVSVNSVLLVNKYRYMAHSEGRTIKMVD